MKPTKKQKLQQIRWGAATGVGALLIIVVVVLFAFTKPLYPEESLSLSSSARQAYTEAMKLAAVDSDPMAAVARLDIELASVGSKSANDQYIRAKLTIYKSDIMLTYGRQFKEGFALLGTVYTDTNNSDLVRSEALMLAMAHALQGLDEGMLRVAQVRDYVFLNKSFTSTVDIGLADAMLLEKPQDTYEYLSHGFIAAMNLTPSDMVYALAKSYSLRLLSPFVVPPPTGGYYDEYVASVENTETKVDTLAMQYTNEKLPYQESFATSYYNLARAYEALPRGSEDIESNMMRIHDKLTAYITAYPDSSFGTQAYLTSISTRLVCKTVDDAEFDATRINKKVLQPYLDEIYGSVGWVVPCKEAFEVIAHDVDPRFATYF